MIGWLRQHWAALAAAAANVRRAPGSFAFNVLVTAIALALPFAGLTALENALPLTRQLAVEPEISLFLALDLPRDKAQAMRQDIQQTVEQTIQQSSPASRKPAGTVFVPREEALKAMQGKSGLADGLAALGGNPLPDAWVLTLEGFRDATDAAQIDALADRLRALPGVETVQVDSDWVKRLAALLRLLRLALLMLAGTLGVVVVAVVFNTIRLQMLTQLEEIEVARLFGATDAFIRRPFYYAGALLGLAAGGVALGAVALALHPINQALAEFARLYGAQFQLARLGDLETATLLALSAALGVCGAALSVRRHLARVF